MSDASATTAPLAPVGATGDSPPTGARSTRRATWPDCTRQTHRAVVRVIRGPSAGLLAFADQRGIVIGSGTATDLKLVDPLVSRRHLHLAWNGRWLHARDLGSKNGAFSGGNRFDEIDVAPGGIIRIGDTLLSADPEVETFATPASDSPYFGRLVGTSEPMRRLFGVIDRVAHSDASVLITGETGVGKELVAEELHQRSRRRDGPFVVVDCGAIPGQLIESLLFGHVRGSFTGASGDRQGLFAAARGGTIFLDEIGELAADLQPRLLRVLDAGTVRAVGADGSQAVDVRVVAATHRDLRRAVANRKFRADLYHRLSVVQLEIPALRDRPDDIQLLVQHLLRRTGRPHVHVTAEVVRRLNGYAWPGNVRELRNVVEGGLALMSNGVLDSDALDRAGSWARLRPGRSKTQPGDRAGNGRPAFAAGKAALVAEYERSYLRQLADEFPSVTAAARAARMDRKQLRGLMRRYGLRFTDDAA